MRQYRNYPVKSVVQHRTGYIFVKIGKGEWISQARMTLEASLGRKLMPNERAFHIDGNRENNAADNLVPITFNTTAYVLLSHARPLFIPQITEQEVKPHDDSKRRKRGASGSQQAPA